MGILVFLIVVALVATVYLLGFRLGRGASRDDVVRFEGGAARRQLHDLAHDAFTAMAEEAMQWRDGRGR